MSLLTGSIYYSGIVISAIRIDKPIAIVYDAVYLLAISLLTGIISAGIAINF